MFASYRIQAWVILTGALSCLMLGWVAGIFFQKYIGAGNLYRYVTRTEKELLEHPGIPRTEANLSQLPKDGLMVALAFGQSNAANYGEQAHTAQDHVYNFYAGRIYRARDPLLGATGEKGSVWTRLGDRLIANGLYRNIIFVPIAVGASSIAQWAPGGALHDRLLDVISQVHASGLEFTHLFWHQGEADSLVLHTSRETYKKLFAAMLGSIRETGVSAPIYVCVATRGQGVRENAEIAAAQKELVNGRDILAGPDTDRLVYAARYDGLHFSSEGLEQFADQWLAVLAAGSSAKDTVRADQPRENRNSVPPS